MKYHLDRRIVLNAEPEHKSLYNWSLHELDADGKKVGRDQIPWHFSLYFTATEISVNNTVEIARDLLDKSNDVATIRTKQSIRAKLESGHPNDARSYRRTSYSMFGTERVISDFELVILKTDDLDAQPSCTAWGNVSNTFELDFRDETTSDSVTFYLHLSPEIFAKHAGQIAAGGVDEAILRVSGVNGFYSEWSPAVSTTDVKVLTDDEEQRIEEPSDCKIVPTRLGEVAEADFICAEWLSLRGSLLSQRTIGRMMSQRALFRLSLTLRASSMCLANNHWRCCPHFGSLPGQSRSCSC